MFNLIGFIVQCYFRIVYLSAFFPSKRSFEDYNSNNIHPKCNELDFIKNFFGTLVLLFWRSVSIFLLNRINFYLV